MPFFSVSFNRTYDVIFDDAPKQEGNLTHKKARLSLNFNDLLFLQRSRGIIIYQNINLVFRQANETRNVRLAFNYSFGNQKLKATRNRSVGSDAQASRVKTN